MTRLDPFTNRREKFDIGFTPHKFAKLLVSYSFQERRNKLFRKHQSYYRKNAAPHREFAFTSTELKYSHGCQTNKANEATPG